MRGGRSPICGRHRSMVGRCRTRCARSATSGDWRLTFSRTTPTRLPAAIALGFHRIAREALSNVARHAGVTAATVHLTRTADAVVMRIADRGAGVHAGQRAGGPIWTGRDDPSTPGSWVERCASTACRAAGRRSPQPSRRADDPDRSRGRSSGTCARGWWRCSRRSPTSRSSARPDRVTRRWLW